MAKKKKTKKNRAIIDFNYGYAKNNNCVAYCAMSNIWHKATVVPKLSHWFISIFAINHFHTVSHTASKWKWKVNFKRVEPANRLNWLANLTKNFGSKILGKSFSDQFHMLICSLCIKVVVYFLIIIQTS